MNYKIDILNNPNKTIENDFFTVNLINKTIVWKPQMFNPKIQSYLFYWLKNINN